MHHPLVGVVELELLSRLAISKQLAKGDRQNILKKAKTIGDYIDHKLTYLMTPYHEETEDVLSRER